MDNDNAKMDGRIQSALETTSPGLVMPAGILASYVASGNVLARAKPGPTRHALLMAAMAIRLVAEPDLRVLVVAPGDRDVASLKGACDAIAGSIGVLVSTIGRESLDADAGVLIGSMDAVASQSASGALDARSFGLIALSDLDAMADAASIVMVRRALGGARPGRRIVAFSAEPGPSHRAMVRDLAGSAEELSLEADGERVKSTPSTTYMVPADDKVRLFSGQGSASRAKPVAVFCNTRDTAESVARQLKAEGFSVEYILGNLPRKRAVFESVLEGRFEILVLTDEGANGLPVSWAHTLVNWDIPLEGEPYLARLAHLDASFDRAHIQNFACDRYSVGIENIERMLGARLSAITADEKMMAPKKAETRPVTPDRQSERQQINRVAPDPRDRGGQYDGRNARAIQADIAAITGGFSLNDQKPAPEAQGSSKRKHGRKAAESRRDAPAPAKTRETGMQKPAKNQSSSARHPKKKAGVPRQAGRNAPRPGGGPRLADPYSVSMEERLRLYRERYGKGAPRDVQQSRSDPVVRPVDGRTTVNDEAPKPVPPAKGILGALKGIFSGKPDQD